MADLITEEQFKNSLPKTLKNGVPKQVMDDINDMIASGEEGETFKEVLMGHSDILKEGKFSLQQYVNATKYISYKILGKTNKDSYALTFPNKMTDWIATGVSDKDISAYVAGYNKSKLVVRLYDTTLVPFHILMAPYRTEALLKEVALMRGNAAGGKEATPMVQHLAAAKVLEVLAPPETVATELQMKQKDSEDTSQLKKTLADLAAAQKAMLENGGNLKDVAESTIIGKDAVDAEYTEVDD